nr:hypothetical protein Iba_chr07dCG7760 [Ipomoea batatas]
MSISFGNEYEFAMLWSWILVIYSLNSLSLCIPFGLEEIELWLLYGVSGSTGVRMDWVNPAEGEKTVVRNRNSPPKGKPTGAAAVNPSRQTAPSSSSPGNISNSPSPAIPSGSRRSDRPAAPPNGNGRGGGRGGSQQPRRGKGRSTGKSGQASVAETSAAGAWRGTIANSGIFQFGGSQCELLLSGKHVKDDVELATPSLVTAQMDENDENLTPYLRS